MKGDMLERKQGQKGLRFWDQKGIILIEKKTSLVEERTGMVQKK